MHNVAIIGAGIGAEHARAYAELPELFTVNTICDLETLRATPLAEQFNANYTSEFDNVLNNADIDIIDVCLPPHLHHTYCLAALSAGKTVVCEKPLVSSLREVDELEAKVAETGCRIFPVFQYRYGLGSAQLHALIEAGVAGRCFAGSLETHWDRDAAYYAVDWRGTWQGEQGGALLGHAIHIHDLLSAFLGPVKQLYAETATRVNEIEVEDCAALAITMESGAVVTSSVSLGAAGNTSRLRLMFEGFTVESDHNPYAPAKAAWTFNARAPTEQSAIDQVLARVASAQSGYVGLFQAMSDALSDRGGREVTLQDGRRSIEFVSAVYSSSRLGQVEALPLENSHPLYNGWVP